MEKFDRIARAIAKEDGIAERSDRIAKEIERRSLEYEELRCKKPDLKRSASARKAWITRKSNPEKSDEQKIIDVIDKLFESIGIFDSVNIPFIKNTMSPKKIFIEKVPKSTKIDVEYLNPKVDLTPGQKMVITKARLKREKEMGLLKYNGKGKIEFRDMVFKYFNKYTTVKDGYTLALESDELQFVKGLPKHNMVIFEKDKDVYKSLVKLGRANMMPNVRLMFPCNIGKCTDKTDIFRKNDESFKKMWYQYAFLDFCNTYDSNESALYKLQNELKDAYYIAFTFCLRGNKKERDNYKIDFIKKLQRIYPSHIFEDEMSYIDTTPMFGIILKNRKLM